MSASQAPDRLIATQSQNNEFTSHGGIASVAHFLAENADECWISPCGRCCAGVSPLAVMRIGKITSCAWLLCLVCSCDGGRDVVEVQETRRVTSNDKAPLLDATSDQRFRDAKPSPVKGEVPESWLALPSTQMRLLNYRFGESGKGQVWVSISTGTVLANVNRWLGQLQTPAVTEEEFQKMKRVPMCGSEAVWVEATGAYQGPGDTEPMPGQALAGAILQDETGRIVTVKMLGPQAEVEAEKPRLEEFIKSMEVVR